MGKNQYLSEVTLARGESLLDYINKAVAACKKENNTNNIEVHQIITINENKFLILLNFYKEEPSEKSVAVFK